MAFSRKFGHFERLRQVFWVKRSDLVSFWCFSGFSGDFGILGFDQYRRFVEEESVVYIFGHDIRSCAVVCLEET